MLTRRRSALDHRSNELRLAPGTYAVGAVRGNVGNIEGAEGRAQSESTSEPGLVLLLGYRMTGRAAAGVEHLFAVSEIRRAWPQCAGRHSCRNAEDPKRRERNESSDRADNDNLPQHTDLSGRCDLMR